MQIMVEEAHILSCGMNSESPLLLPNHSHPELFIPFSLITAYSWRKKFFHSSFTGLIWNSNEIIHRLSQVLYLDCNPCVQTLVFYQYNKRKFLQTACEYNLPPLIFWVQNTQYINLMQLGGALVKQENYRCKVKWVNKLIFKKKNRRVYIQTLPS